MTAISTQNTHQLSDILQLETKEIENLFALLKEEYEALKSNSPDPLERLTQRKQQQIGKLETAAAQQNSYLRRYDLPPNRQGMESLLDRYPDDHPIRAQWGLLEQRLNDCQKQNNINGSLLNQSRQQVSNTLNLLRGAGEGQKTYGPAGEARSNSEAKLLGSA